MTLAIEAPTDAQLGYIASLCREHGMPHPSPKQWQAIIAAKQGPCRVCVAPATNGGGARVVQFHHIVARAHGGDDVADNIAPICRQCHERLTVRWEAPSRAFLAALTDAEYAYMIERGGTGYPERAYGIEYRR